ncbi:MAG TPA: xanthine dehydrogenase family protein molybdopterin-binding subunit [Stellaceae bacterium]|nr:xanthine dehydrogenase family protein molybdopterin-binding subunit [Stellaceae bacterium]
MDTLNDAIDPALVKFGVGQSVTRKEDPTLLRGEGRYTDDVNLPGQAYAVMVRSPVAHGTIRRLALEAARKLPGVLGVWGPADLEAAGFQMLKSPFAAQNRDGTPWKHAMRPALAKIKVRHIGEPVAFVVAETVAQAKDAAEAVECDIDALPAVTSPSAAAAAGAPQLHDEAPGNILLDFHYGDSAKVAEAFAAAAHVTKLKPVNSRIIVNAIEPRAAVGSFDAKSGRFTLTLGCQGVFGLRGNLAPVLGVTTDKLRVLSYNVGGSFGMKSQVFPEYPCVLFAARLLGRPVKWTDERSGSFVSDNHGRDHEMSGELALDKDGRILALRLTGFGNAGAYPVAPLPYSVNAVKNVASVYRTPLIEVNSKGVYTNTQPVGPYRGAGRPEGNYYMERLMDTAADEMGIDRIELRRRNYIAAAAMPYKAASGSSYDSGDFATVLDKALDTGDWQGFAQRKRQSEQRGKLRGLGVASYLEVTAPQGKEMGGIRFEPDGGVTMISGTLDYGQGHASPFAQIVVNRLGIPFEKLRLLQGDSDQLLFGGGTGGSRSAMAGGTALLTACDKVIEQGKQIAAHLLEAAVADIEFSEGRFRIAGTDRSVGILEVAERVRTGAKLPAELPQTLDASLVMETPPSAYPNGCHLAEVEVDPDTGTIAVVKYAMVNDFGNLLNPLLAEGQAHGGVVQGIGQALMERTVFDREGQLVTGSYMDYAMPRADNAPMFEFASHPVPATTNPLGVKGCGEAGCAGALPAVMNAVMDALKPYGIRHIDMPATPEKVWQAIRGARAS